MQIECPKCHALMETARVEASFPCASCRIPLQVEYNDEGVLIVSVGEGDDPVEADHERWRGAALISMISGIVVMIYLAASAVSDYDAYGLAFFRKTSNMVLLLLAAGLALLATLGGSVLFVIAGRELRRYREAVERRRLGR